MTLRAFAGVLAILLALPAGAAEPLDVAARPIEEFGLAGPTPDAAALTFLGGVQLTSPDRRLGGLSGLDIAADGSVFIVTDSGRFVRARLLHEDGRLTGIADAETGNLYPETGDSKRENDVEDIAFYPSDPGRGLIVQERQAEALWSFELENGAVTDMEAIPVSAEPGLLRSNAGLESVAIAPPASHLAGEIVVIAERPFRPRGADTIPGWIVGAGSFKIVRTDDFDISSARFLPDGDLLLLERRYAPAWGIAMRLRRIPGEAIEVGARLDGEILLEAGMTYQIDNMEGLAVQQDEAGRTILTIVSDNNYSILQRSLILQFALEED